MMFVVALLAVPMGYFGWQANIVRERKAMLKTGVGSSIFTARLSEDNDGAIPLLRRWLGDHFCRFIVLHDSADIPRYKAAFPEADVSYVP